MATGPAYHAAAPPRGTTLIHPGDPWPLSRLHIYVHIPVCRARCDYCDFFTRSGVAAAVQLRMVESIGHDIEAALAAFGHPYPVTLYVGGGTPSALSGVARDALLDIVARHAAAETTVEVNPEDVDRDLLAALSDAGVNRISLGVQSLQGPVLRTIGRHTDAATTRRALELIGTEWRGRWSVDLIVGVPGETRRRRESDLEDVVAYGPGHLSLYDLTVVAGTRLAKRLAPSVTEGDAARRLVERAEERGFRHYEVSNCARAGEESRHNHGYWALNPHLGLGPGAVGLLPVGGIEGRPVPVRCSVPSDLSPFGSRRRTPAAAPRTADAGLGFACTLEPLDGATLARELLMTGLRTRHGIDRAAYRSMTGVDPVEVLPRTAQRWQERLSVSADRVALDRDGVWLLDSFLVEAFAELDTLGDLPGPFWPRPGWLGRNAAR